MASEVRVQWPDLEAFTRAMLLHAGLSHDHASIMSTALVNADRRGIDGHGIRLLPIYYGRIAAGGINKVSGQPLASRLGSATRLWPSTWLASGTWTAS